MTRTASPTRTASSARTAAPAVTTTNTQSRIAKSEATGTSLSLTSTPTAADVLYVAFGYVTGLDATATLRMSSTGATKGVSEWHTVVRTIDGSASLITLLVAWAFGRGTQATGTWVMSWDGSSHPNGLAVMQVLNPDWVSPVRQIKIGPLDTSGVTTTYDMAWDIAPLTTSMALSCCKAITGAVNAPTGSATSEWSGGGGTWRGGSLTGSAPSGMGFNLTAGAGERFGAMIEVRRRNTPKQILPSSRSVA